MADAAKKANTQHLDDEGKPVVGHRVKLLGASGIKTDQRVESGQWVEITVRGVAGPRAYDPQKGGTIREITVQANTDGAVVRLIETPPEIEGQAKLDEAEPDNVRSIRDADGNVVDGPSEAPAE